MGENTAIEWATHTMNFWLGCTKIGAPCENCYAESWAKRAGWPELWQGERRRTTEENWRKPAKWNTAAGILLRSWDPVVDAGTPKPERPRVFTNSLADFFDNQVPEQWRHDAWGVIDLTPNLDWLVLTKRPQNIRRMLPGTIPDFDAWGDGWPNVWVGTTVGCRADLRNIDHLRGVPAHVRFLSIEPLLEDLGTLNLSGIHWVIVGGESGPGARPMHPAWARSLRDQCAAAGVPFLFKQWGEWVGGIVGSEDLGEGRISGGHASFQVEGAETFPGKPTHWWSGDAFGGVISARVGKKAAGRLLDGVTHDGFPVTHA